MLEGTPQGYSRIHVGGTHAVAADHIAHAVRAVLERQTLHAYAEHHPEARSLSGRGVAFAAPIGSEKAVVRHNRHGGLLAPVTGDLFLAPTRAPLELEISIQLAQRGVPTPAVLGFAVYPAAGIWRRADVATREVPDSLDLGQALASADPRARSAALEATAELIRTLREARARHEDLNVKNVLLSGNGPLKAWVLDVDRVRFQRTDPAGANVKRLLQSADKLRQAGRIRATAEELASVLAAIDS